MLGELAERLNDRLAEEGAGQPRQVENFHLSDTLPGGGQVSILAVMEAPIGFGDEDGEELQRSLPTVEGMHSYRIK